MILSRVTKHVKEQNWFAVFIDFLIVVVGVFMGLQVTNWHAEQVGEQQAQVLLKRLSVDLKNDHDAMMSVVNYHIVVKQYAMRAVDALNGENAIKDEDFVIATYQASQINPAWSNRATYNEMLSTGQINLIKNEPLKDALFAYYSGDYATDPLNTTIAPYREFIRGEMPIAIQNAIKKDCGDQQIEVAHTFSNTLPANCDLPLADELFKKTALFLRAKSEMLSNLQYQIAVNDTQVDNLKRLAVESLTLIQAIEEAQP
ncbi:hypothetical protein [Aliiglaciecola litoralis]|uniref:Uncharacterized protein n=1 Tax=Aliiglaciecola litoralis TaxID=582857 RepID=A0ABN1LEY9_9ALTE